MGVDAKNVQSERIATDRSLSGEREKADLEFATRKATDEAVVADARIRADEVLTTARAKADEDLGRAQAAQEHAALDVARLRAAVAKDERAELEKERSREDDTLREARGVADQQASRARESRVRALGELLAFEREETDVHLLLERDRADVEINSRDDFLAMVSHDLRNMLGNISMSAASLVDLPSDGLRAAVAAHNSLVQRNTARMGRMLGDLLDVVSIEAGHLAIEPRPHDVAELLRDTLEFFQPIAAAKSIEVHTDVRGDALQVRCDQERILQVLANLLGNAIKFTKEGGRIDIVVEQVEHEIRFAISDTGVGIPADKLRMVFERFWQVVKLDRLGLGLGLYISKSIIAAHGGTIWADSQIGKGSTFYFTLPDARASR